MSLNEPKSFDRLSRQERIQYYGIDCVSELVWKNWSIGGEYKKRLILRNLHEKVQIVQYEIPKTQYFYMSFPVPLKLSPGVSRAIDISFRPIEYENYVDYLKIKVYESVGRLNDRKSEDSTSPFFGREEKTFYIAVKSMLPELKYSFPEKLDFDFCGVRESTKRVLALVNEGDCGFVFRFTSEAPFELSPSEGEIVGGEQEDIEIDFEPFEAKPYLGQIVLELESTSEVLSEREDRITHHVLYVSGIGKYVHFVLDVPGGGGGAMDFGRVSYGRGKTLEFFLQNKSLVYSRYEVQLNDRNFRFHKNKRQRVVGSLEGEEEKKIAVEYRPQRANREDSCECVVVQGVKKQKRYRLFLGGASAGSEMKLSQHVFDFGDLDLNQTQRKKEIALTIRNDSREVKGLFQFYGCSKTHKKKTKSNEVFSVSEVVGGVGAEKTRALVIRFTPFETINYYKRVYVLFPLNRESERVQVIDLLGSGFDDVLNRRPKPFGIVDVLRYHERKAQFPEWNNPFDLTQQIREKNADLRRIHEANYDHVDRNGLGRFFFKAEEEVVVTPKLLFFGSYEQVNEIEIENRTRRTLLIVPKFTFLCNKSGYFQIVSSSSGVEESPFELKKGAKEKYGIRMLQNANEYSLKELNFCEYLELFVFYKSQRTFRLVNEVNFIPPFYHRIECSCNFTSFPQQQAKEEEEEESSACFLKPKYEIEPKERYVFANQNDHYGMFRIHNQGQTHFHFSILESDGDGEEVIEISPKSGYIESKSFFCVFVKYRNASVEVKKRRKRIRIRLNHSEVVTYELVGFVERPKLEFYPRNRNVFFSPSFLNTCNERRVRVKNCGNVDVYCELEVGKAHREVLEICGEKRLLRLQKEEEKEIVVRFTPNEEKRRFFLKEGFVCRYGTNEGELGEERVFCVIGDCLESLVKGIKCSDRTIEFEDTFLNEKKEKDLLIFNSYPCSVLFALRMPTTGKKKKNSDFGVSPRKGKIFGRNHKKISVRYRPSGAGEEEQVLELYLIDSRKKQQLIKKIRLRGKGVVNVLKITNMFYFQHSKYYYWHSILKLGENHELIEKRKNEVFLNIDFGVVLVNSDDGETKKIITIEFEKKKEFAYEFVFPSKNNKGLDEKLFLNESEKLENEMMESQRFEISPKKGKFATQNQIQFIYHVNSNSNSRKKHFLNVNLVINEEECFPIRLGGEVLPYLTLPSNLEENNVGYYLNERLLDDPYNRRYLDLMELHFLPCPVKKSGSGSGGHSQYVFFVEKKRGMKVYVHVELCYVKKLFLKDVKYENPFSVRSREGVVARFGMDFQLNFGLEVCEAEEFELCLFYKETCLKEYVLVFEEKEKNLLPYYYNEEYLNTGFESPLYLTYDSFRFELGAFEEEKRIVLLQNKSDDKCYFEFFMSDVNEHFELTFFPKKGVLNRNEKKIVNLKCRCLSKDCRLEGLVWENVQAFIQVYNYSHFLKNKKRKKNYFKNLKSLSSSSSSNNNKFGFKKLKKNYLIIENKIEIKNNTKINTNDKWNWKNKMSDNNSTRNNKSLNKRPLKELIFGLFEKEINRILNQKKSESQKKKKTTPPKKEYLYFSEFQKNLENKEKGVLEKKNNWNFCEWVLNETLLNILTKKMCTK